MIEWQKTPVKLPNTLSRDTSNTSNTSNILNTSNNSTADTPKRLKLDFLQLLIILVQESNNTKVVHCWDGQSCLALILKDSWADCSIPLGVNCNVFGAILCDGNYVVSQSNGYFIMDPECLVSCTELSEMFGCLRRSVICSKIKNNGPYTHHLLYGDILHRLFQSGLNSIDHSFAYFQRELTSLVSACQEELYAIDKPETQVIEELTKLIPNIQKWISDHSPHAQNKSPKLHQVMDIEERIWSY